MQAMPHNLRRVSIWLAIFAVLLATLAPSVSRIVFKQTIPTLGWIEICTVEGLQQFPAALFENEQSPDTQTSKNSGSHSGDFFEHCPFCFTNACSFGLTPVESALPPLMAAEGHHFPPHALSALHAKSVWQPNQARAPPTFL
ncbi:MAG: DUF2946 domain-containing protein [Betaproteobacteria bacterium]|nr:DUF2946 domain-containing protein [Betaproteobacteria bacterium]